MLPIQISPGITKSRVISETDLPSEFLMAITLYPNSHGLIGIARLITERIGDVSVANIDKSILYEVIRLDTGRWEMTKPVEIINLEKVLDRIKPAGTSDISLEDPDLVKMEDGLLHLYFTINFAGNGSCALGHAVQKDGQFYMQPPTILPYEDTSQDGTKFIRNFKELCPAPVNSKGLSYHLVESSSRRGDQAYSTIARLEASSPDAPWEFAADVVHPADVKLKYSEYAQSAEAYDWCAEHASPCRLLPKSFVDCGRYLLGIMNARSKSVAGVYGKFLPGLFLYDPETGQVPWVDPHPLFDDADARNVIFASDIEVGKDLDGNAAVTLITHIDDSYIQEYLVSVSEIVERLPVKLTSIKAEPVLA